MSVEDDPGPRAAEELGPIQTIENNAARYHVTSHLEPSQQSDSDSILLKTVLKTLLIFSKDHNVFLAIVQSRKQLQCVLFTGQLPNI